MEFKTLVFAFFLSIFLTLSIPLSASVAGLDESLDFEDASVTELIRAERAIKEKLGLDPGNADLYFELSNVYAALFDRTRKKNSQSLGWLMKSGDALEKVVMIAPEHKVARYNLGVVYKREGKMERAREEIKRAIRISNPETDAVFLSACWMQIGSIYAEQGFYDEAEDAFEKAREYDYGNNEILAALADIKAAKKGNGEGPQRPGRQSRSDRAMTYNSGTRASQDPYAYDSAGLSSDSSGGVAQALPYLGQMLAQKFTGGGNDDLSES